MSLRFFFQTILLPLTFQTAFANNTIYNIDQYNNSAGLSNSAINHLFIDSDALLWVGTWDGLNYFDGYSFQHINYARPEQKTGISNNVIQHIQEDSNNNIWITTIGGISVYNKASGLINNYFYSTVPNESISEHEYGVAINSKNNKIYAYTPKQGLMIYNSSNQSFLPLALPIICGRPIKMLIHNNDLYFLNTESVLYQFNIQNNQLHYKQSLHGIKNCFITNQKLFVVENSKHLSIYANDILVNKKIIPDNINAVGYYNYHYFFAWDEKGFAVYDSTFAPSIFMNDIAKEYSEIKFTSFGNNNSGALWMGTDGNGVLKITNRSQTFGTISFANLGIPYNVPIRTFCKNGNDLWMGTKGKGIIVIKNFNPSSTTYNVDHTNFSYPLQLDNNAVYALKSSAYNNLIYIGSDGLGLGIFNKTHNRFYKWKDIEGATNISDFGSVYSIYEDKDSSLWLGTSGYGLIHIKFQISDATIRISLYEKYTATGNQKGPINNIIYSIASAGDDYLWVGCRYGGLNILNKQSKVFKEFNQLPEDKGLSNNDVLYVYNDTRGNLWVGTSYGLNLLKNATTLREKATVTRFIKENGLPNTTIHSIIEDANNNIWVSTNKGIAKIDQQGKNIINYQESDGLQSSEFSDGSVWKGLDNRLFFGGIAGFNNFDPTTIRQDTYIPSLLISSLSIGGKPDNENKLLVIKQTIPTLSISQTLERKSNYFELSLKTINYDKAAKCEIHYYLDGYDKIWHTEKGITKIVYSNLPVGNYALKIKWNNGDNVWSSEKVILNLTVKQYWWLTPLALIVYGLVVAIIAYIIYKYRKDSIEEKHKLEKEKLQRAKDEEIHQNRISFFTNIAHELQTPLTLVIGSFERILNKDDDVITPDQKKTWYYKNLIQQQSAKLTYLLQQLFEFRKIETPYFQTENKYVNITELLKNLAEPFISISESKTLNYQYHVEENINGGIDKDKVEKIVFNLLSNAFKYTPDHENVLLEANKINGKLRIAVFNSGIQLSNEQVKKLFDLFYTSGNNKKTLNKFGTGIGLAFTKQLVELMEGSINVYSNEEGVCFEVYVPIKERITEKIQPENQKPSYLYSILTDPSMQYNYRSTASINKHTILNTIIEEDKDTIVIVEDENEIRYLLRDILKDNYHIYEAENGIEALHLIRQHIPALVISDIIMADMDGLELCNIIKNTNPICHIPVILLSAKTTDEQQLEGYGAGADAYISKPFNAKHLLIRIKNLIEYRKKVHTVLMNSDTASNIKALGLKSEDEQFVSKVYEIIKEHIINPDLNSQFLEKELCMSRMQLYRRLKSLSNMTPNEFIKNARLIEAAKLLQTTKLTVSDIFYQTGFNNQSYFFREFKKKYHAAPNDYREQYLKSV